jgi:hypothetical protein
MESVYPFAHIIHLVLGIIFLGYVFTDVSIISTLKGKFSDKTDKEISKILGSKSFKIFPLAFLVIILTGGMMMSRYVNSNAGFFETDLQKLLMIKIGLAGIIALGILFNLFTKFTGRKKPSFMQNHFHKVVLVLGLFIVVLAKWMFLV